MKVIAIRDSNAGWYLKGDILELTTWGVLKDGHPYAGQRPAVGRIREIRNNKITIDGKEICVHLWKKQNCNG